MVLACFYLRSLVRAIALLLCASLTAAQVAVVRTPDDLQVAISRRVPHIVVADHLDLTTLAPQSGRKGELVLFVVPKAVRSITANCTRPPPEDLPLAGFAPPQCVLQVAARVTPFRFNAVNAATWLHALHIYARPNPPGAEASELLTFRGAFSDAWLTAVNLQGGGGLVRGMEVESARTFIWGGTFSGFHAGLGPAFSLQDRRIYSTTAFENVVFANSSATGTARLGCYESASGLVYISALNQCSIRTGVTFRNCSFRDTVGADVHRFAGTDDVFSDVPLTVVDPIGECAARDAADADYVERNIADYDDGGGGEDYADAYDECAPSAIEEARNAWRAYAFGSRCRAARTFVDDDYFDCPRDVAPAHLSRPLAQLAAAKTPWKPHTYLRLRSPTLLRIQQERNDAIRSSPAARAALAQASQPARETEKLEAAESDAPVGVVVGTVLAAALALGALAALCLCCAVRRRQRRSAAGGVAEHQPGAKEAAKLGTPTITKGASLTDSMGARAESTTPNSSDAQALASTTSGMGVRTEQTSQDPLSGSWRANVAAATHSLLSPQPALASLDDVRTVAQADSDAEALEAVLDAMHECGETFASFFRVHDHFSRRRGGQGIVQFMQRQQNDEEVAVKFFLSRDAFERELAYYSNPKLCGLLVPVVHHVGDDDGGGVRANCGYEFPPFIIVERGEALNEWVSRVAPDLPTAIFVLLQVAEKLEKLHSHALCHRDLKPSNVLWLPNANSWTLMDFGCAAPIGERAHLAFSPHYAAPETIAAAEAGSSAVLVSGALDMWALGIIAYELLTARRTFPPPTTERDVWDQLAGRAPLPWERSDAQEERAALKALRRSVLKCLERDPALRPTSRELLGSWNGLFESMTGTTTAQYVVPVRAAAGAHEDVGQPASS